MSNIHDLNSYKGSVGIQNSLNSSSNSDRDDQIINRSQYKLCTITVILLILNLSIFFLQIFAFYLYYNKKDMSWSCLLTTFGAFQGGKIKNHFQYHRFISSMFLHNSSVHVGSNCLSLFFLLLLFSLLSLSLLFLSLLFSLFFFV